MKKELCKSNLRVLPWKPSEGFPINPTRAGQLSTITKALISTQNGEEVQDSSLAMNIKARQESVTGLNERKSV